MTPLDALRRAVLAAALLAAAAPATAQEDEPQDFPDDPNSFTLGVGAAWRPSYEGSDDYEFGPIGAVFGKVGGFSFATRGTGLALDLIRDKSGAPFSFELGPVAYLRLDRSGGMKDPQVRALGKIDKAIELGVSAGVAKNGLLHKYDSLGVRLQYQKDVSNTHDSWLLTPSIEYSTPLSTRTYAQLGFSMEKVGDGYARTYFSITPTGAAASGLAPFNADGGWKNRRATLSLVQSLTGELRDPKLSLFGVASYARMRGDFARSPIVSVAGDRDQYLLLGGLAYTF